MNKIDEFGCLPTRALFEIRSAYQVLERCNLLTDLNRHDIDDLEKEIKKRLKSETGI